MAIRHSTPADSSFSPAGKRAWDADHTGDASDLSFVQSGIGTLTPVARTAQAKMREVVTSADFTSTPPIGLTGVGASVLAATTTGWANTAVGDSALKANTTGAGNTAFGYQALIANTTGGASSGNTAIGCTSMISNISGDNNTALGVDSLFTNTTGSNNTAIGSNALGFGDGGDSNTAVGWRSLFNGAGGTANTAIGLTSLNTFTTGSYNTGLGTSSLFTLSAGSNNTGVGSFALRYNATGSGNVGVGFMAGAYELGSNAFYVDNQDRTNTAGDKAGALLYGVFNATAASQTLRVNAQIQALVGAVGTPSYSFQGFLTTGLFAASATDVRLAFSGVVGYFFQSGGLFPNPDATLPLGGSGNQWTTLFLSAAVKVANTQVVGSRRTGWTDQTAVAARTDLGAAPTVGALASFCRALYDDLKTHGLIGA